MMAEFALPEHPFSFEKEDWAFNSHPYSEISLSVMAELGLPEDPFAFGKEDWALVDDKNEEGEYEIVSVINRGAFGVVYKGWDRKKQETVAMKEEIRGRLSPATLKEIDILRSLPRHPNVVEFKNVATENGRVFVVMEYLRYNLHEVRVGRGRNKPLALFQTKALMQEILKGVSFLHEQGVVHRDLKPANILFGEGDKVKICDFGLSARLGSSCRGGAGTRWYKAPEVLARCRSYTSAVDMWSVGCIMAEFLLDKPLFRGSSDADQLDCIGEILCGPCNLLWAVVATAASFSAAAALTHSGFDLLRRLLAYNPTERISARDALDHPWFAEEED